MHITEIGAIFVPVADQDAALEFYRDTLGFEVRGDFPYGNGSRWIEVAPPDATNTIALTPRSEGTPTPRDAAFCAFPSVDIRADHAELLSRGVDVDEEVADTGSTRQGLVSLDASISDPIPAQFLFRDPDGNRFLVVNGG